MPIDVDLINILTSHNERHRLGFTLHLQGKSYLLADVSIANSPTPVIRHARDGTEHTESVYKISGQVSDTAIIPLLSKTMLGPNAEFGVVQIRTELEHKGKIYKLNLHTNITSSVQSPSSIELRMILVNTESV